MELWVLYTETILIIQMAMVETQPVLQNLAMNALVVIKLPQIPVWIYAEMATYLEQ